jgi:plastocyanin
MPFSGRRLGAWLAASLMSMCSASAAVTVSGQIQLMDSHAKVVKKNRDFSGVVVWLQPLHGSRSTLSGKHAQMLQKDKTFSPHILPISTGTSVDFPNLDPIFHNAFSNFDGKVFDVALYPPKTSRTVRFDRPGIVRVFCNIHPSMSAIIAVLDSRYFTVTDRNGNFAINDVSPGEYTLEFFHERATPETLEKLKKEIEVNHDPVAIARTTISEAGYLPVAHKNKYGTDYPTDGEGSGYSLPLK